MEWTFARLRECPLVLVALLFILFPSSESQSPLRISKREAALIEIIEDQAEILDARKFYYDPIMIQNKAFTKYVSQKLQRGVIMGFKKQNPDMGKETVAISSLESKWAIPTPRAAKKRQFVLMKKAPTGYNEGSNSVAYFSSFVYVRDFLPNDTSTKTFKVAGVPTVVEWDIWETRHRGFYPGWDTCEFTILFTCQSINDMLIEAETEVGQKVKEAIEKKKGRRKKRDATPAPPKKPLKKLTPMKFDPGNDPGDYNDLYLDLDFHRKDKFQKSRTDSTEGSGDVEGKTRSKRAFPSKGKKAADKKATGKKKNPLAGLFGGGKKSNDPVEIEAEAQVAVEMGAKGYGKGKNMLKEAAKEKKKGLFGGITEMFGNFANMGIKAIGGLMDAPLSMIGMGGIASGVADMVGGLVDAGTGMVGGLMDAPLDMLGGADGPLGAISGLISAPMEMMSGMVEAGAGMVGGLMEAGTSLMSAPLEMMGSLTGGISGSLGFSMEGNPLSALTDMVGGLVSAPMSMVSGLIEGPMNALSGVAGGALGAMSSLISAPLEALGGIAGGGNPLDMITGLMSAPMEMFGGVAEMMGGLASAPMEMLGSLTGGGNPLEALTSLASAPMAALGGVAEMMTGLATAPLEMLQGITGGEGGPLSMITDLVSAPLEMLGDMVSNPLSAVMDIGAKIMSPIAALAGANPGGSEDAGAGMGGMELAGSSPLSVFTRLNADGLEAGKPINALLGAASGSMDEVTNTMRGLASGVSTDMLATLMAGGKGGLTGSVGGLVSGMMNAGVSAGASIGGSVGASVGAGVSASVGASASVAGGVSAGVRAKRQNFLGGKLPQLQMAMEILGPMVITMDPVNQVVAAAAAVCSSIPQMGSLMGQNVVGGVSGTMDSLGVAGMMDTMGMGPLMDVSAGLADSVKTMGDALLSSHDIVGNGLVIGATEALTQMGYDPDFAGLAALGANTASNVEMLAWSDSPLGVRLHDDLQGGNLNGGKHRAGGAGPSGNATSNDYKKWAAMGGAAPVAVQLYGVTYNGAGKGRDFFFPLRSVLRVNFKADDGDELLPGTFYPGIVPGNYDLFVPDRAADAVAFELKDGVIIPQSFIQPHKDATIGIEGKIESPNLFYPESHANPAMYHPAEAASYWLDPLTGSKARKRPVVSKNSMPIFYGYFFQGIRESPHLFLKEGEGLSGFFVPDDEDFPEYTETPRGVFFPSHPAGHGRFGLEDADDFETVKEIRGAFVADASNLAVAIGGTLTKVDGEDGEFSFILDKPAVDFSYIKGHPSMANIWSPMLAPEEWQYIPPAVIKPEEPKKEDEQAKAQAAVAKATAAVGLDKPPKEFYGTKIVTQKTSAFFPDGYPVTGIFIPHDPTTKYVPFKGTVLQGKPYHEWKVAVTEKSATPLPPQLVTCLFQPDGFQEEDAVIGKINLNADNTEGTILFSDKQHQTEYFWTVGQEIWTPIGFADLADKDAAKGEAAQKKQMENGKVPGVTPHNVPAPEKPPNYYWGRRKVESPEMDEMVLNDLPRKFQYGFYYIQEGQTTGPLFIPDTGAAIEFTPDGGAATKGSYVPQGPGAGPAKLTLEGAEGTGTLTTELVGGTPSKESVKGTVGGGNFECTPACEIIPGWKYATTQVATDGIPSSRKDLNYGLVDLGGGFVGIVVDGPAALEDANNPIFQEFLHYKAHRDGGTNPWGDVIVLDPVVRPATDDGSGVGELKSTLAAAEKTAALILSHFFLRNWEWPMAIEEGAAAGAAAALPAILLGGRGNVVNMLDFRMYLLRKYSCKRAALSEGKTVSILAPYGSERYVNLNKAASPRKEWVGLIIETKETIFLPQTEAVLGVFSAYHNLDVDDIEPLVRKRGTPVVVETKQWMKEAPFRQFGGDGMCDDIELSEFEVAQAGTSTDNEATGVDLGLKLIAEVGSKMNWPAIAGRLIQGVEKKRSEAPGEILDDISTADLLGAVKNKLKANLLRRKSTQVHSAEATTPAPPSKRRKREVDEFKKKLRKRKKRDVHGEDDNGEESSNIPGWRTQHKLPEEYKEKMTLVGEGLIFYGLGNCKQEALPDYSLLQSRTPSNVIEYYLKVLRVDCMDDSRERVRELFNDRLLEFGDDRMYFEVPQYNRMIHAAKLMPDEVKRLSVAFELSAFSKTYHKLRTDGFATSGYIEEPNCIMSRSVGFLTEMTLYYIEQARKVIPAHSVRMTRNLLKSLRSVLTKIHQDQLLLEMHCKEDGCPLDKKLVAGDKFRLVSLTEFIIHGLRPFYKGEATLKDSFYKFVGDNKDGIQERVDDFARMYSNALVGA